MKSSKLNRNVKKKLFRKAQKSSNSPDTSTSSNIQNFGGNDNLGKKVKFCLNMIVRDEKDNILRCFHSVDHLIDAMFIVDTGSVDNTIEIIQKYIQDTKIQGEVVSRPWKDDFGYNRTEALRLGEDFLSKIDPENEYVWYFMFMDADNQAFSTDGTGKYVLNPELKNKLTCDSYDAEMRSQSCRYHYPWLIRFNPNRKYKWYLPRHEYVAPDGNWGDHKETKMLIGGGYINSGRSGYRSKNPYTYLEDAFAFLKALQEDPKNDRLMFYAAQSMRDAKQMELANILYKKRFNMGGWNEEVYMSMLHLATVRFYKGDFGPKTIAMFLDAFEKCPTRLEAPYYLVKIWRIQKKYHLGWHFAKGLLDIKPSQTSLFVDLNITEWGFYEEASLCAYYAGQIDAFRELSKRALSSERLTDDNRKRIQTNLEKYG